MRGFSVAWGRRHPTRFALMEIAEIGRAAPAGGVVEKDRTAVSNLDSRGPSTSLRMTTKKQTLR